MGNCTQPSTEVHKHIELFDSKKNEQVASGGGADSDYQ